MDNKKKINAFDCICVTDVRIIPLLQIEVMTHTKALAEIVFNDQLLIRGIRVVEGENGLYISYPFHPTTGEDGQPRSTVFPITKALRDHVEAVVIEKYQDVVKKKNGKLGIENSGRLRTAWRFRCNVPNR